MEEQKGISSGLTGQASTATSTVSLRILSACHFYTVKGYNVFSMCYNATNKSIENVFGSSFDNVTVILKWNTTRQEFDTYSRGASSNSFDTLEDNTSYF